MRNAKIERKTNETAITLALNLDGEGAYQISTGVGFFNHMLELFTRHGGFDLTLDVVGDLAVDAHHTVEDTGICLGKAFREAIGDGRGIARYGDITLPMDETLVLVAVDCGGRSTLVFHAEMPTPRVGDFDTELVLEFFTAFVREAGINLHINLLYGTNTHHIIEGIFKATARALATALTQKGDKIPSTKGVL